MARQVSVAPKERINIVYQPKTDATESIELPLRLLMMGDYTLRQDDRLLEDRQPVSVDKDNFDDVMAGQALTLDLSVANRLTKTRQAGDELAARLAFKKLRDFEPDKVAEQIPQLQKLLEIRQALVSLKGPLGNIPAFRKKLQRVLNDVKTLNKLLRELGIEPEATVSEAQEG